MKKRINKLVCFILCFAMAISVLTVTTSALVSDGTEPISVAAGGNFTVALRFDGTVWAWGQNNLGQLGNASNTASNTPVQVRSVGGTGYLTSIVAIAAGQDFALALGNDGRVFAWGNGAEGRLGNGLLANNNTPVQVSIPATAGAIVEIAAGTAHSIARTSDGRLVAWGNNGNARLGDGTLTNRPIPVFVLERGLPANIHFENVIGIAAGDAHSVALRADGTVWAWGNSANGRLGNPSVPAVVGRPEPVYS